MAVEAEMMANAAPDGSFASRLIGWYEKHGRHDLPWQQTPTPYRVWVSEIMLQQTQVRTVIPYFNRFMSQFPSVHALARARQDDVLALWAGLGYYARARHMHRAAQQIVADYNGCLPESIHELIALPGIGRSTAGAILALSRGQRHSILDGNVKRVLARYHAVAGWPGTRQTADQLWRHAEQHTPDADCAAYTQAIMDLGATVCTRRKPNCEACPLATACAALYQGRVDDFPGKRPRRHYPERERRMLAVVSGDDAVLLEKRPPTGIWGGLWSLPELDANTNVYDWCLARGLSVGTSVSAPPFTHDFSHFRLRALPTRVMAEQTGVMDDQRFIWYRFEETVGLPAPIKKFLGQLLDRKNS